MACYSCGEAIWAASNSRTLERLVSEQRDLQNGDYDMRTPLPINTGVLLKQGVKPIPDRWGGYGYFDAKNNNHKDIVKEYEKLDINYAF